MLDKIEYLLNMYRNSYNPTDILSRYEHIVVT
jgi:hypothetical protein